MNLSRVNCILYDVRRQKHGIEKCSPHGDFESLIYGDYIGTPYDRRSCLKFRYSIVDIAVTPSVPIALTLIPTIMTRVPFVL